MKCPACGGVLSEVKTEHITVDVCRDGCGGIWFDRQELDQVDDRDESCGEDLLQVKAKPGVKVDLSAPRQCPRCGDVTMIRRSYSPKREAEIDECGQCGGIWLDVGEFAAIRRQYASEADRRRAAHEYAKHLFGEQLAKLEQETGSESETYRRLTRAFRFLCPGDRPGPKPAGHGRS